jgi:hypothetical protein
MADVDNATAMPAKRIFFVELICDLICRSVIETAVCLRFDLVVRPYSALSLENGRFASLFR